MLDPRLTESSINIEHYVYWLVLLHSSSGKILCMIEAKS
jgi:hypothetical protein